MSRPTSTKAVTDLTNLFAVLKGIDIDVLVEAIAVINQLEGKAYSTKVRKLDPRDEVYKFVSDVTGICEASRNEQSDLWSRYTKEYGYTWKEGMGGYLETVGKFSDMPVCISLSKAVIKRGTSETVVLFWEATSQVVDHRMIEEWIELNLSGISKTNAMNFHNCLKREA